MDILSRFVRGKLKWVLCAVALLGCHSVEKGNDVEIPLSETNYTLPCKDETVSIPDRSLLFLLQQQCALNRPLLISDLASEKMTRLHGPYKSICRLDGLQYCVNLREIDLSNPFARGSYLNRYVDLAPLSGLPLLESLDLSFVPVSDISPLAEIRSLERLSLKGTKVHDLAPLNSLPNLRHLDIGMRSPGHLGSIAGCKNLEELSCLSIDLVSLDPLKEMSRLESLNASFNNIDLNTIPELPALQYLNLVKNPISDLTPLVRLQNLQTIKLDMNPITDVEPLRNLTQLRRLDLRETEIRDLTHVGYLRRLEHLNVSNNKISDLSPLSRMKRLNYLGASYCEIEDIRALAKLSGLEMVWLTGNRIQDLSPLLKLKRLQEVHVSKNPLSKEAIEEQIPKLRRRGVLVEFTPQEVVQTSSPDALSSEVAIPWDSSIGDPSEAVEILDHALRAAVRETVGKATGEITLFDTWKVRSLTVPEREKVLSLSGLEHFPNLVRLECTVGDRKRDGECDLSALPTLRSLTELKIGLGDSIVFPPLESLSSLRKVYVITNGWRLDMTCMTALSALEDLRISSGTRLIVPSFRNAESLCNLSLGVIEAKTLGMLRTAKGLKRLSFIVNQPCSFAPLTSLTELESLSIYGHPECSLAPIGRMHWLKELDLNAQNIVDISPLAELPKLTKIRLQVHPLSDLRFLGNMGCLRELNLYVDGEIRPDLTALAKLDQIQSIKLGVYDLDDGRYLNDLPHLKTLFINIYSSEDKEMEIRKRLRPVIRRLVQKGVEISIQ